LELIGYLSLPFFKGWGFKKIKVMNKFNKMIKLHYLRFLRKLKPYNRYTYPERLLKKNITKLISNPGNRIQITSSPTKVYIQSKDKSYNIVFSEDYIKFTNHKFFLKEPINPRLGKELIVISSKYLNNFLKETEDEIFKNESIGLANMLNNINKQ
jgi:CRISPR/Cas system-associated protein Cas5 (RAMP superfamily)